MRHHSLNILRPALAFVLLAASLGATAAPTGAQAPAQPLPAAASTAVLVGLRPGATLVTGQQGVSTSNQALEASVSALHVQSADAVFHVLAASSQVSLLGLASPIDLRAVYRLRLPAGANVPAAVSALSANPAVLYAEPDFVAHLITTPNDPLFGQQWGLSQISAPAAWSVTTGNSSVAIAVIDSGLDTAHPDLGGQLWTNPGEIAGNGLDDDNDGHVDDLHGWNLLGNNADLSDNNGHGTEVAGIAAAATNNSIGVAGVCWACKLMVVKVAQPSGVANYSDIAAGVAYAAQKGAKVINLSLGGNSDSITLRAAIASAAASAVIVGGAGNDNSNALFYPAAYPDVLAVAGTTLTDTKVATSNFGSWVDVAAPGEAITTTFSGGTYGASSGTSLAAPFAAGLAGLLFSQHPGWSAVQVRAQIIHTAQSVDAQNPSLVGQLGSGRIDAASAVTTVPETILQYAGYAVSGQSNIPLKAGAALSLAISLNNDWAAAGSVSATLVSGNGHVTVTKANANWGTLASGQTADNATDPFQVSVQAGAFGLNIPFTLNILADGVPTTLHFTATTESVVQPVSGLISTNTTWTNNRIWQVVGSVSVGTGFTLTIQPGTVVKFNTGTGLLINGTLIADATPAQAILFTSAAANPAAGDWGANTGPYLTGIYFGPSSQPAQFDSTGNYLSGSILRYATIEYGRGIGLYMSGPFIDHNLIWKNGGINSATVEYEAGYSSPQAVISHNRIVANSYSLATVILSGGQVMFSQNLIADNDSAAIDTSLGVGLVVSNTITNNGTSFLCANGTICLNYTTTPLLFNHNNVYGNSAPPNVVVMGSGTNGTVVAAPDNYWGTADNAEARARIYDSSRDGAVGTFDTNPILTQPEPTAPAFLAQVNLDPASPVGIQHVTFALSFSAPMDQSINPVVSFGSNGPFDTYPINDNAVWLDSTHWQATYDITALVPRGTYKLNVSGAQGADGMAIPTDTRFGFTVGYAGTVTDQTPPPMPWILADGAPGQAGYATARWSASDPNSPIIHYRYAIGTAAGTVDVVNWTLINATTVTRTGLGLVSGRHYWFSVQAQNQGGLWSPANSNEFVAGVKQIVTLFLPFVPR